MAATKKETLSEFSRRAIQRMEAKKVPKKRRLHVPSMDMEITIRSLREEDLVEISEIDSESRADKYTVYLAVTEPDLQETAKELQAAGEITDPVDVVDIFEATERAEIIQQVMDLSGWTNAAHVTVVDTLKN